MLTDLDPRQNYEETLREIGYIPLQSATQEDYDRIGFKSGLEVHQQLLTAEKLFCHCPAGVFQKGDEYDAEVIRHMRPTLSELGEYDGTALMEFKTKKQIVYHIKNITTCTYEVDDTPPFPINREALKIAIRIAMLCKMNIVGEVHITRKQYLDGSIPTGFQRTAIIGVGGELPLKHKKVRLIQLSIEEDSCREISDIGHVRVYKTDRLGMPLIEVVTEADCVNPAEVAELCNYIRFLNRSTGQVRTGMGASRQDVNVSCAGGARVEIKGVPHIKWIPRLTHNESFRQWALLNIRKKLLERLIPPSGWKLNWINLDKKAVHIQFLNRKDKIKHKVVALNLPQFRGILSHFLQPERTFEDEISSRLKVIACLERPNMTSSESFENLLSAEHWRKIREMLKAEENDAQIVIWGPEADIQTAIETVEERCRMAFEGIPKETRRSYPDGTTIFERVLPGADRMYPDTDSAAIPLTNHDIEELGKVLPDDVIISYNTMKEWGVPEDTYTYIFKKNLFPVIEKIYFNLKIPPKFTGAFIGQRMKYIEGQYAPSPDFNYDLIYELFKYLSGENLSLELAYKMLPVLYEHPNMDYSSALHSIGFRRSSKEKILAHVDFLIKRFDASHTSKREGAKTDWIMGQLRKMAEGNIELRELKKLIDSQAVSVR